MKAKDLKFRRWIEVESKYFYFTAEDIYISDHYDLTRQGLFEDWNNMVIEQYIGIKDKHGNEIYEGDLVIYDDFRNKTIDVKAGEVHCVTFYEGAFGICGISFQENENERSNYLKDLKIVGKIHEGGKKDG